MRCRSLLNRRKLLLLFGGLSLIYVFAVVIQNFLSECNEKQIQLEIQRLCYVFRSGDGGGSFCSELCSEDSKVVLDECFYLHQGKAHVYGAELNGEKIILKSSRDFHMDPRTSFKATYRLETYPSVLEFESMILTYIKDNYNLNISSLKDIYKDTIPLEHLGPHQMETIWALVNDNEYVLSKYFSEAGVFPELLGTCGTLLAVERLVPLEYPSSLTWRSLHFDDFVNRAKLAYRLLEFLEKLEKIHDETIYLCDVKEEHFGSSAMTGAIKFLDLDSVLTKNALDRSIASNHSCSGDADCGFFDCAGKCGASGLCETGVINNNINIVCDKIFRTESSFFFPGLFPKSKHVPKEMRHLLSQCQSSPNQSLLRPQLQKALASVIQFSLQKYEL